MSKSINMVKEGFSEVNKCLTGANVLVTHAQPGVYDSLHSDLRVIVFTLLHTSFISQINHNGMISQ